MSDDDPFEGQRQRKVTMDDVMAPGCMIAGRKPGEGPTPRTDAVRRASLRLGAYHVPMIPPDPTPIDPWQLAEQLEREVAEERTRCEQIVLAAAQEYLEGAKLAIQSYPHEDKSDPDNRAAWEERDHEMFHGTELLNLAAAIRNGGEK